MPKSDTLTKAHIVAVVVDTNGHSPKKAFETIEILPELTKRFACIQKNTVFAVNSH